MARLLDDWLSSYLKYMEHTEPPVAYHIWCAISAIAGVMQRKCYMRWGHDIVYPNHYIILVGPSAQARKGSAIGPMSVFLKAVGVPLAAQSLTREAFIKFMMDHSDVYTDSDTKERVIHHSVSCVSGELSVFLGQKDIKFTADLTDLYDSHDEWTYKTKHGEQTESKITGVCLNLLGGTAPDWLPSMFPSEAIGGGFTSRCIFVVETRKGKIIVDPNKTPPDDDLRDKLIADLNSIKSMSGQYVFSKDAMDLYSDWYTQQEHNIRAGRSAVSDPRFSGYMGRRATHIKKLCMVLTASRTGEKVITSVDFMRARKILEATEIRMPEAFGGVGRSKFVEVTEEVRKFIRDKGNTTEPEILNRLHRDVDAWTLEQIMKTLLLMRCVKKTIVIDKPAVYTYVGDDAKNIEDRDFGEGADNG